ncbi:MAG: M14-type cytosolic carboxypeptidase [Bryobacteraceae bacterium]
MIFGLLALAAGIHTNFEAGSIGKTEWLSESHLRAAVVGESDQNKRNRQPSWFYFRIDGAAGRDLTVDLSDLAGEYNFRKHDGSGLRSMHPVFSYDNRNWTHFEDVQWLGGESTLRIRFSPKENRVWLARLAPYTTEHLDKLLNAIRGHPHLKEEIAGKTPEGRPMRLLTVTNPGIRDSDKQVVWLMARQHSWESGTSWVAEGALRFLLSNDSGAGRIRDACVFKIFPMADPDGVARGGVRFNEHGYDLNRNWDTVDARLMPEIHAQRKAMLDWVDSGKRMDLFLTLHNTESVDYIQGPLESGGPAVRQLGERFWRLLVDSTAFHSPKGPRDAPVSTTPGMKGRMTVNQGLFHDRKIPAFLMEQMVDVHPKLSRGPTVQDRMEFGAGLVRAISQALGVR